MNESVIHKWKQVIFQALPMLVMLFSGGVARAQTAGLDSLQVKFDRYRAKDLQEKLFVHTDKDFYLAGEIIWFKVYDINGASGRPFDFSKVAYVELLNKNKIPVLQTKVAIGEGEGGSIALPDTLSTGNYLFRAYTAWMKNFSPAYYFQKAITVVNTLRSDGLPKSSGTQKINVGFFPEGGNLVGGLQSEIGFHVTDQYGKGVDFRGAVIDQNEDTVLHFQPFKFGMGHFDFTPVENNRYKAVIRTDKGIVMMQKLPEVYAEGDVMHVQDMPGNKIQVTVNTNNQSEKYVYLLIHTRQSVKVAEVLSVRNGKASLTVDKNKLGAGISQITVFNEQQQPLCERLYFKSPGKELVINTKSGQRQYDPRQKVSLHFQTSNKAGKAVSAAMSVSVYKVDSLQGVDKKSILSYLWLTSDLRGRIESPGYYFNNSSDSVAQAVDNLMLTQGWRRFDWNNVTQSKPLFFKYAPELSGLVVAGTVTNPETKSPAPDVLTYLSVPGKRVRLFASQSNKEGAIYFNMKNFYGKHEIVVETNTQSKDSIDRISLLAPFSESFSDFSLPRFSLNKALKDQLSSHHVWMQVQHAYSGNYLNEFTEKAVDSTAFYGKPYKTYRLDDYTRYVTMEEVMREYVMEVAVRRREKHYHLMVMNALFDYDQSVSAVLFQDDPLVLLDGVPVFNIDSVMAVDPLKVQKLEVVAGRYFWGPVVADGIVSYTTYKGDMNNFPLNPHALVLDYTGLQQERKFYSPVYENDKERSSRIPDFRNVLYWSPGLHSDDGGNAGCSFYTSDLPGQYVVIVNGITAEGDAGSSAFTFQVQKD